MLTVKKQGGFTLIEIIVSITVIPLLWFAVYISLSVNTMLISQAKHRAQAVFIAQRFIDVMRAGEYQNLSNIAGGSVAIDTRGTADTADDLLGTMSITLGPPDGGGHYRPVNVTISWNERALGDSDRVLTESLTTIISDDTAG